MEELHKPLLIAGGSFWTFVYIFIIRRNYLDKSYGMPMIALLLNYAWEITYVFIYPLPGYKFYIALAWFIFDCILFYQLLHYNGPNKNFKFRDTRVNWLLLICLMLTSLFFVITYRSVGGDWNGRHCAYILNVIMSIAFIYNLNSIGVAGQSVYIGVLKLLGTLLPAISIVARTWQFDFFAFLTVSSLLFDVIYIVLLFKKMKEIGLKPLKTF